MPKTPPTRCVCGAWIVIEGHGPDTIIARFRFIQDHRPCREALDAEIKTESKINCARVLTICNA